MLYESKQHYEHLLNEYYQKYFDREPDKTGFQYYLELLLNGKLTENELRLIFLKSDEYRSFQQKTIAHKKLLLQNNNSYVYKGKFGILYNIDPLSMLDNVVEINGLPLSKQRDEIARKRRHGMGYLGLGSSLAMMKMTYGDEESLVFTEEVTKVLAVEGWKTGIDLAKEITSDLDSSSW